MKKRGRVLSLKDKLFLSVYSVIFVLFFFTIILLSNTIRSYNDHYYDLISSLLNVNTDTVIAELKNYEKVAADIVVNDSIQSLLSEAKDSSSQLRITTSNTIRNVLSQNSLRLSSLNTIVVVPVDKSTAVVQSTASKMPPSEYLAMVDRLDDSEHGKWLTTYCSESHLIYVCRVNRLENVKLDTIGYIIFDIDLSSFFSFTKAESFVDEYTFVMMDEDYNLVYKTSDDISGVGRDYFDKASKREFSIASIEGDVYFTVVRSYSTWRFVCLVRYTELIGWLIYLIVIYVVLAVVLVVILTIVITRLYRNIYAAIDALRLKFLDFTGENVTLPDKSVWNRNDELGVLHEQFDEMAERVKSLTEAKLNAEMEKKRTHIEMLQLQISPHFVLNALQMLDWRAKKQKDAELSLMIESLGRILQVSLSKDTHVYLDTELNLVEEYIYIQQKRNPERIINLAVDISDDSLFGLIIPKFSIQPLVENACRYASASLAEISIVISGCIEGGKLHIKVSNTGSVYEDDLIEKLKRGEIVAHGNGIGMMNIIKRIEYAYGPEYGLRTSNENGMATVEVILPVKNEEEECFE